MPITKQTQTAYGTLLSPCSTCKRKINAGQQYTQVTTSEDGPIGYVRHSSCGEPHLKVDCPTCHRPAGKTCRTNGGYGRYTEAHLGRRQRAEQVFV